MGEDRPENHKPILGEAAEALRAWLRLLQAKGLSSGPLFRRTRRGGHLEVEGLSDHAVGDRAAPVRAGRDLGREGVFGAFAARRVHDRAALQKVPLDKAMVLSGHHDVKTALGYIRRADMKGSAAASLIDRANSLRRSTG